MLKLHNNKKLVLFCVVLLFALVCLCGFTTKGEQRVFDYSNVYTSNEIEKLEQLCQKTAEEIKTDIVIVTTDDFEGKTATEYADDFYDSHSFGAGSDRTGILLLFNMKEREIAISDCGKAIEYFSDSMIDDMIEEIGDELGDKKYMGAARQFVDYVKTHMWHEEPGVMDSVFAKLFVAVIVSGIIVALLAYQHKPKMSVDARTYLKDRQNHVLQHSDIYLRTSTTSHTIQSSSDSSRGGSTHTSSSGTTHGGHSGKF